MSEKEVKRCKECNADYLGVNWISYRVDGYCSKECVEKVQKRAKKKAEFEARLNA